MLSNQFNKITQQDHKILYKYFILRPQTSNYYKNIQEYTINFIAYFNNSQEYALNVFYVSAR